MTTENRSALLRLCLGVIPTGLLGACFWLFPYFGVLTGGYAVVTWLVFASFIGLFGFLLTMKIIESLPEDFGAALFIGVIVSVLVWLGLAFTNTYAGSNDVLVVEKNGQLEVREVTEERLYPFWNNDFIRVRNVNNARVSYNMDTPCEGGNICTVEASVTYTVTSSFAGLHAYTVTNYRGIMYDVLTVSVVRDGATTIPELEAAVCSNFKAHFNLEADAPCPLTTRVSVSVRQR